MALSGIYALANGRIFLSKDFFVTDFHARVVGIILIVPGIALATLICFKSLIFAYPILALLADMPVMVTETASEATIFVSAACLVTAILWMFAFRRRKRVPQSV